MARSKTRSSASKKAAAAKEAVYLVAGEEVKVEVVAKEIAQRVVDFLNEVDLPKKFNFWWIITNVNSIRRFIEDVIKIVKDNKNK